MKFSNWRAVAHTSHGDQHFLYMGGSAEQVKKNFPGSFYEVLTLDEQYSVVRITIEKWYGYHNNGNWKRQENTRIPRIYSN